MAAPAGTSTFKLRTATTMTCGWIPMTISAWSTETMAVQPSRFDGKQELDLGNESAHRPVLYRSRRQQLSIPRLRRAAGRHHRLVAQQQRRGPARRLPGGGAAPFEEVGGGGEPLDTSFPTYRIRGLSTRSAFWGLLTRYDRGTGITRNITVWPDYPGGRTGSLGKISFPMDLSHCRNSG